MVSKSQSPRHKILETKVLKRKDISDELMLIWVEKPINFKFKPGQYCTIGIDGIERAYSIVSAPHESELELFVELVPLPDGVLTPKIWKLDIGDTLTIRPRAKGLFVFNPKYRKHLLVSTVTGIVPYVSILRDYIFRDGTGHEFHVLQGASYIDEFVYDRYFDKISLEFPEEISYLPTISRPNEDKNKKWNGQTGRVNEIVEEYINYQGLNPEDTLVYACGHPGMIEDLKYRCLPLGFKVDEERFWKDD